jgi:hypothetical protein
VPALCSIHERQSLAGMKSKRALQASCSGAGENKKAG